MIKENKVRKYMLYAIGEIVLVVIGILIALNVNNWNEANKNNRKTTSLLMDYREDLVRDTLTLSEIISTNESGIKLGQKNITRMSRPYATFDTIKHIARYEHDPFVSFVTSYSRGAFNSMIETSAFELLSKELKRKIVILDLVQKITLRDEMVDQYFELIRGFTLDYPFGDNRGSGYLNKISWNIQNERDFVVKYNAMCTFRILLMTTKKNYYKSLLVRTKQLITDLDQYIPERNSKTP